MTFGLSWRPAAEVDLRECAAFLAADNLEVALRFIDAAEAAIQSLAEYPQLGTATAFEHPELRDLRQLVLAAPFNNYVVFYRADTSANVIDVLRVLHGAMDTPRQLLQTVPEDSD